MADAPKGLHAKLAEVMAEAGRIPKNGTAPVNMGGYKFVQVGDAADAIRKALGERGVSMLPTSVEVMGESEHETRSGGTMTTQTVRTTWTLTDGETGQTAVIQSLGTGADSGDKFSPKAQTNAMKYALLMGFLLSTGDDPENADLEPRGERRPAAPPRDALPAGEETLAPKGTITRTGTISKGSGRHSDLTAHQTPDGWHIGFRLELDAERSIPQVVVQGALGRELLDVIAPPAEAGPDYVGKALGGMLVDVTGDLYEVRYPGRRSTHRLIVSRIVSANWDLPKPTEAPSVGMFDAPGGLSADQEAELERLAF